MAHTKAKLFIQDDCVWCDKARKEIQKRKKEGTLCYDFEEVNITKLPESKIPKNVNSTPMVQVGRRFLAFDVAMSSCPRK